MPGHGCTVFRFLAVAAYILIRFPWLFAVFCLCVTLASHCFHQSQERSLSFCMRPCLHDDSQRRICHGLTERERERVRNTVTLPCYVFWTSWTNTQKNFGNCATGSPRCLEPAQETGNYPRFPSWLAGTDYKRKIVFVPAWQQANRDQMQKGTGVASPRSEQPSVGRLSVEMSELWRGGISQWHSWTRDSALINNNTCATQLLLTALRCGRIKV